MRAIWPRPGRRQPSSLKGETRPKVIGKWYGPYYKLVPHGVTSLPSATMDLPNHANDGRLLILEGSRGKVLVQVSPEVFQTTAVGDVLP